MRTLSMIAAGALSLALLGSGVAVAGEAVPPTTIGVTYDSTESTQEIIDRASDQAPGLSAAQLAELYESIDEIRTPVTQDTSAPASASRISQSAFNKLPVAGGVAAGTNRRTWTYNVVVEHSECKVLGMACTLKDRRRVRVTIDPSEWQTRVTTDTLYFPSTGWLTDMTIYVDGLQNGTFACNNFFRHLPETLAPTKNTSANYFSIKGNGFAYYLRADYLSGGTRLQVRPGRTEYGACSKASIPTCKW